MTTVFADTFYFLAYLNPDDNAHSEVSEFTDSYDGMMVTTEWVLLEVADAMAQPQNRQKVVEFLGALRVDPQVKIIPYEKRIFDDGFVLFADRRDKSWSLTDCISFAVMQDQEIREALTSDQHFVQAGFVAKFKKRKK